MDKIECYLEKWADWMRLSDVSKCSYPKKASGGFVESWIKDNDDLLESADIECIIKIDASIESLDRCHQESINRYYKIRYINTIQASSFDVAKQAIKPFLIKRALL